MQTITKAQLAAARIAVGVPGADLVVTGAGGEVKFRVGYLPGIHYVDTLKVEMAPDDTVTYDGAAVTLLRRSGRLDVQRHEHHRDTGANQDFEPQYYTEHEARMREQVKRFNRASDRLEKRQAALLQQLERLQAVEPQEPEQAPEEQRRDVDDPAGDTDGGE